jgi:MATE family multidrug resistance protein
MNFTAVTLGAGLNSALDTLCSQCYGRGDMQQFGLWLQRGFIIVTLSMIPCLILVFFARDILSGCGQDSGVSIDTGSYLCI